jgi:trehalose-6-phosphate synthase
MWAGKPYNLSINANHNQNSLNRLLTMSDEEKNKRINKGYQVAKKMDWEIIAEEYLKLYQNISKI